MPTPLNLYLLSTDSCVLCEQAFDWLLAAPAVHGQLLETVEITEHPELFERYATTVPVLLLARSAAALLAPVAELPWPFDETRLKGLLRDQRVADH